MTVPPPPMPPMPPNSTAARGESFSVLAILSALALVVPLIGPLVAIVFGAGALARIRRAEAVQAPRLRGKRLAYAGLGLGAVLLVGEFYVVDAFMRSTTRQIDTQVATALDVLFGVADPTQADAVVGRWSGHEQDRITRDELLKFTAAIRDRYGAFRSMSIVARDEPEYSLTRQVVSTAVAYRFERGERMGALVMLLEPDPTAMLRPRPRLAEVTVDDRELGTLRLGPTAAGANAPAPSVPALGKGPDGGRDEG